MDGIIYDYYIYDYYIYEECETYENVISDN